MNKERLFEYLGAQGQSKLLNLLNSAFDVMNTNQRHEVFGKIIVEVPPSPVEGKKVQIIIKEFYEKSMVHHYYASFDINSKNFLDIPEKTDAWFDEIGDQEIAVQCFKILHELIDKMEDGTWMISGDEKRFVKSYLTSLSEISTSEEYTIGAIPLIKRDSWESFSNKVYSTAIKICNKEQKVYLKKEVEN